MLHAWRRYTLPLAAVALMLFASACDTNEPEITTEASQRFEIQGALNVAFEESSA